MAKDNIEIEAKFLNVNPDELHEKLIKLGAKDLGEDFFREIIFYDKELKWKDIYKFFRLRSSKEGTKLALKHFQYPVAESDGFGKPVVKEIELKVDSEENAKMFLEEAGFVAYREQEKKRHSYTLDGIVLDIDTWPSTPSYVEIEGDSEVEIQKVAEKLGFKWKDAEFRGAGYIIEKYMDVKVRNLRYLTFSRIE